MFILCQFIGLSMSFQHDLQMLVSLCQFTGKKWCNLICHGDIIFIGWNLWISGGLSHDPLRKCNCCCETSFDWHLHQQFFGCWFFQLQQMCVTNSFTMHWSLANRPCLLPTLRAMLLWCTVQIWWHRRLRWWMRLMTWPKGYCWLNGRWKNRGDQITRMEWERIAIDRKKQHGIPLELAWLWGAKIGVCASVYSSCYWGAFDGSKWVIELGQRLLRNFLSSQQSDVLGSSSQSRRCRWHRTTHAADELQQEEHDAHSQHVFFLVLSVIKWVQRCWTYLSMACISAQHHVRHCVIYAYAKR